MGLFSKKPCPLCGGKTGAITYRLAGNEKICRSCERMLRGMYNFVRKGAAFHDTLYELDLNRAKRTIDDMKARQQEDAARFSGIYSGILSVLDTFTVPAIGLEEGGPDIVSLGGHPVVLGFCECGSFRQGDHVLLFINGCEKETEILKLIPCNGAYPFEEELIVGAHETECEENTNAWLVMNIGDELRIGDMIAKKI